MNDLITTVNRSIIIEFKNKGLAKNSIAVYNTAILQYIKFLNDNKLTPGYNSIKVWLDTFENPKTYNLKLSAVKGFYQEYFKNEPIEKRLELSEGLKSLNPKSSKRAVEKTDYIKFDDFKKLIKNTPDRLSLIIQALFWSGCRISELINIKIQNCELTEVATIRITGKGSKERQVYLPLKLFKEIQKKYSGVYLFETHLKTRLDRINVTKDISKFSFEILKKRISAHTLRHSKAMFLKEVKKLTPDQIAKALGHTSVVTTLTYYFHGTPGAKEQGIF